MANIFEVVYPRSYNDPDLAEYEYMLCWYGRNGASHQYLFYDVNLRNNIRGSVVNSIDPDRILSITSSEQLTISLMAEDLSLNDVSILGQIIMNRYVIRLRRNGDQERMAPMPGSFRRNITDGRYNIRFNVQQSDKKVWR